MQTEFSMGLTREYVAHQLNIPTIRTYHTIYEDYLHYVFNDNLLRSIYVKQFAKAYLRNMNGVVAPSKRVGNLLKRYGVQVPIRVIPTRVDIEAMNSDQQRDVRPELGTDSDDLVILTLSRIATGKEVDRILNLMLELIGQLPNLKLVITGDGSDINLLRNRVEHLSIGDYVILTDDAPHEDTGDFYRMAGLFISASDTEA